MSVEKISSLMLADSGTLPAWDGSALTGISSAEDIAVVQTHVATNFFLDAVDSSRAVQHLSDGFVDQFEDQLGVDDPSSTNEVYDTSGDYYSPSKIVATTSSTSAMTNLTVPSGTASASNSGNGPAWFAFQHTPGSQPWATTSGITTGYLQYAFNNGLSAVVINRYKIEAQVGTSAARTPKNWTIKASNTGAFGGEEVTLDTRTGITYSTSEVKEFTFANTTAYVFYRMDVTAVNSAAGGLFISVAEWNLYSVDTPQNITLISEPSTALAVPTNAHVTLFKEDVDATTVNTDIMAWASRSKQTFTATNATNLLNATAHGLTDGDRVMLSSSYYDAGNKVPNMTSNTSPSGTASASGIVNAAVAEWKAFDSNTANSFWNENQSTNHLQFAFNNGLTAQAINEYDLWNFTTAAAPVDWKIEASNTGAFGGEQVILHTVTGTTWGAVNEEKNFSFSNTTAYVYYRMNITLNGGGSDTAIAHLQFRTSTAFSTLPAGLSTSPIYHVVNKTADTFQVAATNGGSAVALTDDGTETHSVRAVTAVTLTKESTISGTYDILSGLSDISAQPSGTNMNLVVQTKNNKDVKLHGQSLQWS